jgi:hypothetical protein
LRFVSGEESLDAAAPFSLDPSFFQVFVQMPWSFYFSLEYLKF